MKRWMIILTVSGIISIILLFDSPSIPLLMIGVVVFTSILFGLLMAISYSAKRFSEQRLVYGIGIVFLFLVLFMVLALAWEARDVLFFSAIPSQAEFGTNMLTGDCDFLPRGGNSDSPWYYRDGCDISQSEKMKVLEEAGEAASVIKMCHHACDYYGSIEGQKRMFCDSYFYGIPCDAFVECGNITC